MAHLLLPALCPQICSLSLCLLLLCKQVRQYLQSASYFSRRGHGGLYTVSLAGAQLAPSAVYSLLSGLRQTRLEGEGHIFSKTNWTMGHQGRQNCDNLKWLYMVAFVKKNKNKKFQEPLQDQACSWHRASVLNPATPLSACCHTIIYMEIINLLGFPGGSASEESACNAGDLGLIPELGRSPGEGNSYLLHYSGLENSMDCIVHGVAKNRTQLSDFHFDFVSLLQLLHSTTLWYTKGISAVCYCKITQNLWWYRSVQVLLSIKQLQFTHLYDKLLTMVRVGLPSSEDGFKNQMK